MEGPFDPHSPDQDPGASQPEAQDGDLHALLERLLGQGDVRPSAPGAGDDLWPDLLSTAPPADEVSTIVPAPDAPLAIAELPPAADPLDDALAALNEELAPARAWEPVVVEDTTPSTEVDDIHAAILASVSVDLEPLAPVEDAPEADTDFTALLASVLEAPEAVTEPLPPADEPLPAVTEPLDTVSLAGAGPVELTEPFGSSPFEDAFVPEDSAFIAPAPGADTADEPLPAAVEFSLDALLEEALPADPGELADTGESDAASFSLTPFEAPAHDTPDMNLDAEALWAAALPELGHDVAPQLDLDGDDEPAASTAVVLPWPSHEPKASDPADTSLEPHDLIEAALAGLSGDLTSEPVEPLRTPDVAAATAHVLFRLGSRAMAIPLAAVSEIARPPRATRLPHVPAWVLGIANLRGDIVSILDLEGFLSGKAGRNTHEQRMLALHAAGDDVRTAVLVDSVDGIQAFEDARIARVTRGFDAEVAPYARGLYQLEDELVVVLDADRLLQSKPMRQFEDGAGAR
jgi:twitching motility protein PilI